MSGNINAQEIIDWINGQITDCNLKSNIKFSAFNSENSQFKHDQRIEQMQNQKNAVDTSAFKGKLNLDDKYIEYQIQKAKSDLQTKKYNEIREHINEIYENIKQRYNPKGENNNNNFINNFNDILLSTDNAKKFPDISKLEALVDRILELT